MPKKKKHAGNKWCVSIPIAGTATFIVEAADEEEAKARAWEAVDDGTEPDVEWEYFDSICDGNVLHVSQNEVEVASVADDADASEPK